MRTKYHQPARLRTLGPQAANLVEQLHDRSRPLFRVAEAVEASGLSEPSARSLLRHLVNRGVATRLQPGLFILNPLELGSEGQYAGHPWVVARELARGRPYCLSHATAMEIHGMLTQPQLVVRATSSLPIRSRSIMGTEFRFTRCKPGDFFGTIERWADKREKIMVSDLERTVLDGLKQPEHCGGITEVARGLWIKRTEVDTGRLVDYALHLGVGAAIRRLGFLLATLELGSARDLDQLRGRLTGTYSLLDPILPSEGRYLARWRLRLNVSEEEIRAATRG